MIVGWLSGPWKRMPKWLQNLIAHRLNAKYTVGTNILIFNAQGQVWLQKHRFWPTYPWGLPGGYLQAMEEPAAAAVREIKEEISADLDIIKVLEATISPSNKRTLIVYYLGQFASDVGQLDEAEILDAQFFDPYNLPTDILPSHQRIIHTYKHHAKELTYESKR